MENRHSIGPRARAHLRLIDFVSALMWVVAALSSLVASLVAVVLAVALARNADDGQSSMVHWLLALLVCLGMPGLVVWWRHRNDWGQVLSAMIWMPAVWNLIGFSIGTQFIPDLLGMALRGSQWVVEGKFGETHSITRALSALGHEAANKVDPDGDDRFPGPETREAGRAVERVVTLDLGEEEGNGIFVEVEMEGPHRSIAARYLFDTGASYTTITTEMAHKMGIVIPDSAPTLDFNTAAGPRSSKMVYLPSLKIGDQKVKGLLVSICDACATDRYPGLLGINVMREFYVDIDYQSESMRLTPRIYDGQANRAYDIEPVVTLTVEGRPELWLSYVRWMVRIKNRSSVPIFNVIPKVVFTNGTVLYGKLVERIDAGKIGRSLVRGQAAKNSRASVEFALSLAQGQW